MKKIKNIGIVSSIFLALLFISNPGFALLTSNLQIRLLRYEPFPAEPGSYVRIWFNIENNGLLSAKNVEIQLLQKYPFFLDEKENATRYLGEILPKDNAIVDYLIRVAPDAIEGRNNITIRFRERESEIWNEKSIEIYVKYSHPTVSIENIRITPTFIEPGKSANLSIMLKNIGESDIRNVITRIDLSNQAIAMNNDVNEKIIKYIKGNDSKEISFNILSYPNASCGFYKIPILIKYSDYLGNEYSKEYFITFIVGEEPKLELNIEKSEVLKKDDYGNIEVSIINRGSCEAKLVKLTLEETGSFKILSPSKKFYIGSISPDDYELFDFKILVKSDEELIEIPIILEYADENKNKYIERRNLTIRLYPKEEISRLYSRINIVNIVFLVMIILTITYLFYLKRKKKRI